MKHFRWIYGMDGSQSTWMIELTHLSCFPCYPLDGAFLSLFTSLILQFPEFRSSKSIPSLATRFTQVRANYLSEATAKYDEQATHTSRRYHTHSSSQVFRFASSKNASLFLQRKNPRKIAWTTVYRKMHKKGITEEVAKKRSRKTVKHQRGIVGADLATIAARRNQTAAVRTQQRLAAITKAKSEKKEKETKKAKVRVCYFFYFGFSVSLCTTYSPNAYQCLVPKYQSSK